MKFFKKRKQQPVGKIIRQEWVAGRLAKYISLIQRKWASCMDRLFNGLPVQRKRIALAVFCLVMIGTSLYCIINSFAKSNRHIIAVASIKRPVPAKDREPHGTVVGKENYDRIHHFKLYMDSLARSPSGKQLYDSLITIRPHLMDSINIVENIFQSQLK